MHMEKVTIITMGIIVAIALVATAASDPSAAEPATIPEQQTNLGPLILDENFEVYFNTMTRSASSCFEVVRRNDPSGSAIDCVTGVISPEDMEIESREMLGEYHERLIILLNSFSGFRCTIIIPTNPGPEDTPSIGC